MTRLVRYYAEDAVRVGVWSEGRVWRLHAASVSELLRLPAAEFRSALCGGAEESGQVRLLPPVDGLTEIWAAGVTYHRSSEARQEESTSADVYARVYAADRPELFFKSVAWRVVGTGEPIGIRSDSAINVPEPELAIVVNALGEVVGATICNDVSSRSIEGENPLYLPQAKIYAGSCALGPGIVPIWEIGDLRALPISIEVERGHGVVYADRTTTSQLHRTAEDLLGHLTHAQAFPDGFVLATGTGLVPDLGFTLRPGDRVSVSIGPLGTLENVVWDSAQFAWLTPTPARRAPDRPDS